MEIECERDGQRLIANLFLCGLGALAFHSRCARSVSSSYFSRGAAR